MWDRLDEVTSEEEDNTKYALPAIHIYSEVIDVLTNKFIFSSTLVRSAVDKDALQVPQNLLDNRPLLCVGCLHVSARDCHDMNNASLMITREHRPLMTLYKAWHPLLHHCIAWWALGGTPSVIAAPHSILLQHLCCIALLIQRDLAVLMYHLPRYIV
jgi:hypothetical protein